MKPDLLNVREAAKMLKISPRTATRWCEAGKFPNAFKVNPDIENSAWLIPRKDVNRLRGQRNNK